MLVLSATSGRVSIALFATIIGVSMGIRSPSLSLVFSISNVLSKQLLEQWEKRKNNKIVSLARGELNSIENIISKALTDAGISSEKFTPIINEEEKYFKLKESIRTIKSQRGDTLW